MSAAVSKHWRLIWRWVVVCNDLLYYVMLYDVPQVSIVLWNSYRTGAVAEWWDSETPGREEKRKARKRRAG